MHLASSTRIVFETRTVRVQHCTVLVYRVNDKERHTDTQLRVRYVPCVGANSAVLRACTIHTFIVTVFYNTIHLFRDTVNGSLPLLLMKDTTGIVLLNTVTRLDFHIMIGYYWTTIMKLVL